MNEKLKNLLHEWQPRAVNSDELRAAVWKQIAREEPSGCSRYLLSAMEWFERPAVAFSLIAVAMVAGGYLGSAAAGQAQTQSYLATLSAYHNVP